jgi:hypothetical protein
MSISRLAVLALSLVIGAAPALAGEREPEPEDYYPLRCIQPRERVLGLEGEYAFNIRRCADRAAVLQDLQNFLVRERGHVFEWFFLQPSSLEEALALLATDHGESDGSGPYAPDELATVRAYLDGDAMASVELGEFADSYMSGTGITALVALTSVDRSTLVLLSKFRSAE